jgi:hypothetical protein
MSFFRNIGLIFFIFLIIVGINYNIKSNISESDQKLIDEKKKIKEIIRNEILNKNYNKWK